MGALRGPRLIVLYDPRGQLEDVNRANLGPHVRLAVVDLPSPLATRVEHLEALGRVADLLIGKLEDDERAVGAGDAG